MCDVGHDAEVQSDLVTYFGGGADVWHMVLRKRVWYVVSSVYVDVVYVETSMEFANSTRLWTVT